MITIQPGDRVQIHLDDRFGGHAGWYTGIVTRIEPYSKHRCFYWVKLDIEVQAILRISEISVFNPKNIKKAE
jgi:hypothetical protein